MRRREEETKYCEAGREGGAQGGRRRRRKGETGRGEGREGLFNENRIRKRKRGKEGGGEGSGHAAIRKEAVRIQMRGNKVLQ